LPPIGFPAASNSERIPAVFGIGGNIKGQHVDLAEQVFDGLEQSFRAALCASVAKLGRQMMLVQMLSSPTLATRFAALPCGFLIRSEKMFVCSM
jgi:hypothetical protein